MIPFKISVWKHSYISNYVPDIRSISSSASISHASLTLSWKSSNEVDAEDDTDLFSFFGLALKFIKKWLWTPNDQSKTEYMLKLK